MTSSEFEKMNTRASTPTGEAGETLSETGELLKQAEIAALEWLNCDRHSKRLGPVAALPECDDSNGRKNIALRMLRAVRARSASVTDAPWMEAIDLMITGEHGGGDPWWRGFQMLKDAFFAAGGNHPAPWAHDRCWVDDHHTEEAVKGFTTPTAHGEGELVQRAIDAAHEAFFQHLIGRQPRAHFDDMLPPRRNSDARDAVATALKTYRAALSHAPSPPAGNAANPSPHDLLAGLKYWAEKYDSTAGPCLWNVAAWMERALSPTLREAAQQMLDDHQTSDTHHPNHILVPRSAFEAMRTALSHAPSSPQQDGSGLVEAATHNGFVCGDGANPTKWMHWDNIGPVWKDDPWTALRFARREDAEAFCAENEDAWRIVSLVDALAEHALASTPKASGEKP